MNVTSADGTIIGVDRSGEGPAVILVHGGFTDRSHPTWSAVAAALAPEYTVYNYDRRGRGGSGDTAPYSVDREIEDIEALIKDAGGSALLVGGSSGAALAALATAKGIGVNGLIMWEPPYIVGDFRPPLRTDLEAVLTDLVAQGRRGDAAELFMVEAAQVPADMVAQMRSQPFWGPQVEAVAHTLAYECAVLGPGNPLPTDLLASITVPTLVLTGGNSPAWMTEAGKAAAAAIPAAEHRVLADQIHDVSAEALAPAVAGFFATAISRS